MSRVVKLSDIAEIIMGQSPKGEDVNSDKNGVPLLNGPTEFGYFYPVPIQYTECGKKFAEKGSLLFCVRGSTVGRMNIADQKYVIGRGLASIKGKNGYSTEYVKVVINNYLPNILNSATGSTFPNVSKDILNDLAIEINSVEDAKYISLMSKHLNEKICLNIEINQTLEQIAQAIFKSWFVDFDPVKAKIDALANGGTKADAERAAMQIISGKTDAELTQMQQTNPDAYKTLEKTAALFPSEMVESELGEVPKGWGVTNFGSVSVCFDNQRIPLSKQQREKKKGSIPYYGATSIMDYVDEAIFNGIYLLMGEDGSVIKNDGTPFLQYIWGRSWINNHAHVLQGKGSVSTEHLMLFLSCTNISAYVTGAVQLKLNQKNMNSIPFLLATDDVNSLFYEKIKFLYEKIRANSEENDFLIKIRDSLLPKLLSGDLG
ncbi:restriction endonuclease subunit S [Pasteurella sp. PK-2025]|uniref:restriction endonuclease subunit S n=1 Tax=Pasteurella sp. PK-2025 TaxID=3413133 RepID=UPI003C7408ED